MAKVNAESQAGEGTVWFDYFVVTNSTNASSTSFTTSTPTTSTSSITNSGSATPMGQKSNVGGILGGIIGGVILILIIFLCLWRKNNSGKVAQLKPEIVPDSSACESPFFLSFYRGLRNLPFRIAATGANHTSPFDTNPA